MLRMRIVLALLVCAACGKNTEPPPPTSGSPQAQTESGPTKKTPAAAPAAGAAINEEAKVMFANVCATCHGADGTGNTPMAQNINPKPRNYTDAAWQASVTDDELRQTILLGGQGVGKSPLMPGNPQLKGKPEVLDGLVAIVRSFGKK
jgi:cytochrome c553